MRMAADCRFNFLLVVLSVAFAIAFSYSALRLAFYFRDAKEVAWRRIGSALVMGAAICAMHYTGMAAARSQLLESSRIYPIQRVFLRSVPPASSSVTSLSSVSAILSSFVDRRFHAQALELALAQARIELAYVGRAASLGGVAASIAHEINQPLGAGQ